MISYNNAENNAGAIAVMGAKLYINGGRIIENTAPNLGKAIYVKSLSQTDGDAQMHVYGGEIYTTESVYQAGTGVVHFEYDDGTETPKFVVGGNAYIYGSKAEDPSSHVSYNYNVYLDKTSETTTSTEIDGTIHCIVPVVIGKTLRENAKIGLSINILEGEVNFLAGYSDMKLTTKDIENKLVCDDETNRIYVKYDINDADLDNSQAKIYIISTNNASEDVVYVASDYVGNYDGLAHSIYFEFITETDAKVQFYKVASLDSIVDDGRWLDENPAYTSGKHIIRFRIVGTDGSVITTGHRYIDISNIVPTIDTSDMKLRFNIVVNKSYIVGVDAPAIDGGRAIYDNGSVVKNVSGSFSWTQQTFKYVQVGMQDAYITFTPTNTKAYSPVNFTIKINVLANELYYKDGNFYLTESDATYSNNATSFESMEQALNSMNNDGIIYIYSQYEIVGSREENWNIKNSVKLTRIGSSGTAFAGDMIYVRGSLVISADAGITFTIDGGAKWTKAGGFASNPTEDSSQNTGYTEATGALIVVNGAAKFELQADVVLTNNDSQKAALCIENCSNIKINGLQIKNNRVDNNPQSSSAIDCVNSKLIVENITLFQNKSSGSTTTFNNSEIVINQALIEGNKALVGSAFTLKLGSIVELKPTNSSNQITITQNTASNYTIYLASEDEQLIIYGCNIYDNIAQENGSFANIKAYDAAEGEKNAIILEQSDCSAAIKIVGELYLELDSTKHAPIINQYRAIEIDSQIKVKLSTTTTNYPKIGSQLVKLHNGTSVSAENYVLETSNLDDIIWSLVEIVRKQERTIEFSNFFTLYVYNEHGSNTIYGIRVKYGDVFRTHISASGDLENVIEIVDSTIYEEDNLQTVKLSKTGYRVSEYKFYTTGAVVDLDSQVYYTINKDSDYCLYPVWIIDNPQVEIVCETNTTIVYGDGIITLKANVLNKSSDFEYSYEWYKNSTKLVGEIEDFIQIKDVNDSGTYFVKVLATLLSTTLSSQSVGLQIEIEAKPIYLALQVASFDYTGEELDVMFKNGVSDEGNIIVNDVEFVYPFEDNFESLGIGVEGETNKKINAGSYELKLYVNNPNYEIYNSESNPGKVFAWEIKPTVLQADKWINIIDGTEVQGTGFESNSNLKRFIVPVWKDIKLNDTVTVEFDFDINGANTTTYYYYFESITNNKLVDSINSTNPILNYPSYTEVSTYTMKFTNVNNSNYKLPDEGLEFKWYITGAQAVIESWFVGGEEVEYEQIKADGFVVEREFSESIFNLAPKMKQGTGGVISSGIKLNLTITGELEDGSLYGPITNDYEILNESDYNNASKSVGATNAGIYKVSVSIVTEYSKVDLPKEEDIKLYYIFDGENYIGATVWDETAEYFTLASYEESPDVTYEITFVIKKQQLDLTWSIIQKDHAFDNANDTPVSEIVYDSKTYFAQVVHINGNPVDPSKFGFEYQTANTYVSEANEDGYTISAVLTKNNDNYEISEGSKAFVWRILKKELTIKWPDDADITREWTGTELTFNPEIIGLCDADKASKAGIEIFNTAAIEIGDYECTIDVSKLNNNYKLDTENTAFTKIWSIVKRSIKIKWNVYFGGEEQKEEIVPVDAPYLTEYNGSKIELRPTIDNLVDPYIDVQFNYSYTGNENLTDVGDYIVTIDTTSDPSLTGNHAQYYTLNTALYNYSANWIISPAILMFNWSEKQSYVYDGTAHSVPVTKVIIEKTGVEVNDLIDNLVFDTSTSYVTEAIAVGEYKTLILSIEGNNNYTVGNQGKECSWIITKRPVDVVWTTPETLVYTGYNQVPDISESPTMVEGNENSGCITGEESGVKVVASYFKKDGETEISISRSDIVNVGTYIVKFNLIAGPASPDTSGNYEIVNPVREYTITPIVLNFAWSQNSGESSMWIDGSNEAIVDVLGGVASYYMFSGNIVGTDEVLFTIKPTVLGEVTTEFVTNTALSQYIAFFTENSVNRGDYGVEIVGVNNSNYTLEGAVNAIQTWKIKPATLDVTQDIFEINGNLSAGIIYPTYNGKTQSVKIRVRNVYNQSYVLSEDNGEITVTNNTQVNAGDYFAKITLKENSNYVFLNGAIESNDYYVSWKINKLIAVLKWQDDINPDEFKFNGTAKTTFAIVENVQQNDEGNNDIVTVVNYSKEQITPPHSYSSNFYTTSESNVGTYCAKALQLSNPNYEIDISKSYNEWTIQPKQAEIIWTPTNYYSGNDSYDKTPKYYSASVSSINLVPVEVTLKYFYSKTEPDDYTVWQELAGSSICVKAGYYKCDVEINDTNNFTPPTDGSTTKVWQIKQKTLTFGWSAYEFTYTGTTVNPSVNIIRGVVSGDDVKVFDVCDDMGGSAAKVNVGDYKVKVKSLSGSDAENYIPEDKYHDWKINPLGVKIIWQASADAAGNNWTYGNGKQKYYLPQFENNSKWNNLVVGLSFVYTIERTVQGVTESNIDTKNCILAGDYTITVSGISGVSASNFVFDHIEEDLTKKWSILQKEVTFEWSYTGPIEYTGQEISVVATVIGADTGDTVNVDTYEDNTKTTQGNYQARVLTLTNTNYKVNTTGSTWKLDWKIIAIKAQIDWIAVNIADATGGAIPTAVYSGEEIGFVPVITNLLNSDQGLVELTILTKNGTTIVAESIDAGNYERTIEGLQGTSAVNYDISDSTVTIKSKAWIISKRKLKFENPADKIYNGTEQLLSVNLVPAESGHHIIDSDIGFVKPVYIENAETFNEYRKRNAGTYTPEIKLNVDGQKNYMLDTTSTGIYASIVIRKASLTFTWLNEYTYTYNGDIQYPQPTISGIQMGEAPCKYNFQFNSGGTNWTSVNEQPRTAGKYKVTISYNDSAQDTYSQNYEIPANNTQEFVINSTDVSNWLVVPLQMGDAATNSQTILLAVLYGVVNGNNGSVVDAPAGSININYLKSAPGNPTSQTLPLSNTRPSDNNEIYLANREVVDGYLQGKYVYAFISYSEYNVEGYRPSISYVSSENATNSKNYKDIVSTEIAQTLYPSNSTQSDIEIYYKKVADASFTKVSATTPALEVVYGETVSFYVTGGEQLDNNSYLISVNETLATNLLTANQLISVGQSYMVSIVYFTDDANLNDFTLDASIYKVGAIRADVTFTYANEGASDLSLRIRGY